MRGDDTTVPVFAMGKIDTGGLWVYVRDDVPFGVPEPPVALFQFSRDRRGEQGFQLVDVDGISAPSPFPQPARRSP
ncbi:IS66 family transposase [Sphingobium subterraneum]|uniref:IS66 family transposase n=1 Tax=Sphingobium subterraneum TaxID=627688 RepID=UPI003CCD14EE